MERAVFFDTNVWCDYFIRERPNSSAVFELIEYGLAHDYLFVSAACSMKDLHYFLQADSKRRLRSAGADLSEQQALVAKDQATACIEAVTELAMLAPVGYNDVRMARSLSRKHPDFEDNVIVAAAMRIEPVVFVSSDRDLVRHAPLNAMTPIDALEHLKMLDAA